ncbi:hypothetical protein YWY31_22490 [Paenibacillus illinoisensis]
MKILWLEGKAVSFLRICVYNLSETQVDRSQGCENEYEKDIAGLHFADLGFCTVRTQV